MHKRDLELETNARVNRVICVRRWGWRCCRSTKRRARKHGRYYEPRYDGYKNYRRGENHKKKWHCKSCKAGRPACLGFSEQIWIPKDRRHLYALPPDPNRDAWDTYYDMPGRYYDDPEYKPHYWGTQPRYSFPCDESHGGWIAPQRVPWVHR